jgi:hypothetical protein
MTTPKHSLGDWGSRVQISPLRPKKTNKYKGSGVPFGRISLDGTEQNVPEAAPSGTQSPEKVPKYLIWSNEYGAWWRANSRGYTTILSSAGHYTRDDALNICAGARDGWRSASAPSEIPVRVDDAAECNSMSWAIP